MTNKQRKEHKIGNQLRKRRIMGLVERTGKRNAAWFYGGNIQDGKYAVK